jgi:hypothetical protein
VGVWATVRGAPAVDLVAAVPGEAVEVDPMEAELDRLAKAGKLTRATAPKTKVVLEDLGLDYDPLERILAEREADVWPRRPYPEDAPS